MSTTTILSILAVITTISVGGFALWRNEMVYRFRLFLLSQIRNDYFADADLRIFYSEWRWDVFNSVTYENMLIKFWKPLRPEEWYNDTSFLEPTRINDETIRSNNDGQVAC